MSAPTRSFPVGEFESRLSRAQTLMAENELDALFLTTEPEIRYLTGFLTRFWESPTRPWFLIIPASGRPIAVIPAIGEHLMRQGWIEDIRTWDAPDYTDDGVGLLAETLRELVPGNGNIGVPSGMESHLHMPLDSWAQLQGQLDNRQFRDDANLCRRLRMVKSELEVGKIRHACTIAGRAFDRVPEIAGEGVTVDEVFRSFQRLCLEEGADWVSYLAGGAGQGGYGDVISPASPEPLRAGDVLMLDTGVVWDGYFSDYDRNFAILHATNETSDAYQRLLEASDAAFELAKPGVTASDLFHAMDKIVSKGRETSTKGRLGHGLGMQLTEWPSLIPADHTVLVPGMVLTLEPVIELPDGSILVHEENIVIAEKGAEYLSPPTQRELPTI